MPKLNWKPHTQPPGQPVSAVLAAELEDNTGEYYLLGHIHIWNGAEWRDEASGNTLDADQTFYWLAEADLVASLAPVHH